MKLAPLETFEIPVFKGKAWKESFVLYSDAAATTPVNLTGASMILELRTPEDAKTVKLTITPTLGGALGTVTWTVAGTVTANWAVGTVLSGVLFLTDSGGTLFSLCNVVATVYQP